MNMCSDLTWFCGQPEFLCVLMGTESELAVVPFYLDFLLGKSGVTICLASVPHQPSSASMYLHQRLFNALQQC